MDCLYMKNTFVFLKTLIFLYRYFQTLRSLDCGAFFVGVKNIQIMQWMDTI